MTDDVKNCGSAGAHPSDCDILEGYRRRAREKKRVPTEEERVLLAKAEPIRLLLLDVDGVLTDGRLYYSDEGIESKTFNTKDGLGIRLVQKSEVLTGIITARQSRLVARRAEELGMDHIRQGARNKLEPHTPKEFQKKKRKKKKPAAQKTQVPAVAAADETAARAAV